MKEASDRITGVDEPAIWAELPEGVQECLRLLERSFTLTDERRQELLAQVGALKAEFLAEVAALEARFEPYQLTPAEKELLSEHGRAAAAALGTGDDLARMIHFLHYDRICREEYEAGRLRRRQRRRK